MPMKEIPKERWKQCLYQFSRVHRDWPAKVETCGRRHRRARKLANLPLLGVTDEQPGNQDERIRIMLGGVQEAHLSHTVEHPVRLRVAEWNDGYSGALEIESADGAYTTVQVGPAQQTLPPGMITDGMI